MGQNLSSAQLEQKNSFSIALIMLAALVVVLFMNLDSDGKFAKL